MSQPLAAPPAADPDAERQLAALMAELVARALSGSDATAGLGDLVRRIEERQPGFIERLAALNVRRRLGLPLAPTTH